MTTLQHPTVASLLDRFFTEANKATSPATNRLPRSERDRLLRSKTDYLELYSLMKDLWLPVSREAGQLLYMLARSTKAKMIVEFGTSFGISTLHLAASLRDNGGGRLITSEFEPSKVAGAKPHLTEGGLTDLVESRLRPGALVVADNAEYCPEYLERVRAPRRLPVSAVR